MDRINWKTFTSTDFTYFCNALLSFEISKKFEPFTAPGKDGGTDGKYVGSYLGLTGKWRFQYKFHTTPKSKAFSTLKSELKSELAKIIDDDYFVFLTNISLRPTEVDELNEIADAYLLKINSSLKVYFWDEAKIFTLYIKYPILKSWLEAGFTTAQLQSYEHYFKTYLQPVEDAPVTFINDFTGRKDIFSKLDEFIADAELKSLMLRGEAGIGKTRLVIEYFKKKIDGDDAWQALVLANYNIDFDKLSASIGGEKNLIILVDDAHQYSSQAISDIRRNVAIVRENKVKVIFNFRNVEFDEATRLIKEKDSKELTTINLNPLSEQDTKQIFDSNLQGSYLAYYTQQLINISRGRPILIVALLTAAKQNIQVAQIKSADFLKDFVHKYFRAIITEIQATTGLSILKIQKFIQLMCLLEPLNFLDERIMEVISAQEQIDHENIRFILKQLNHQNLLSARHESEIKPDYYSDILLMDADTEWLSDKVKVYPQFIHNIIRNLTTVDEVNTSTIGSSLLDNLLDRYVAQIQASISYDTFLEVITTINSLNGYKPQAAIMVINSYCQALQDPAHELHQRLAELSTIHFTRYREEYVAVKNILSDLVHRSEHFSFVFTTVFRLYETIQDQELFGKIFAFSFTDAVYQFQVKKQLYFAEHSKALLTDALPVRTKFIIECYRSLLKLEFQGSVWDTFGTSIRITRYYLPDNSSVNKLRVTLLENLVSYYQNSKDSVLKGLCLHLILDIPREITSSSKDGHQYNAHAEVVAILNFLETIVDQLQLAEKSEVLNQLYFYKQWRVSKEFRNRIKSIEKKITNDSFPDQLVFLFSKAESDLSMDIPAQRNRLKEASKSLLNKFDSVSIADGIADYLENSKIDHFHFEDFFTVLLGVSPYDLKEIYEYLWAERQETCLMIGSAILRTLYFVYKENEYYWQKIALVKSLKSFQAYNSILHVYTSVGDDQQLGEEDAELILYLYANRFPENEYGISLALIKIVPVKEKQAMIALKDFLGTASHKNSVNVYSFMSHSTQKNYEQLKELVLEHSHRFSIGYEIETALKEVIGKDGFEPVFKYLKQRVEMKFLNVRESGSLIEYEAVPYAEGKLLLGLPVETVNDAIIKVIDWYLSFKEVEWVDQVLEPVLDYLNTNKAVTPILGDAIQVRIIENQHNLITLNRLALILEKFEEKNALLISLLAAIFAHGNKLLSNYKEGTPPFLWNCRQAITNVGGKHGTAGEPFPTDLLLKELLENSIPKYQSQPDFANLLKRLLDEVIKDIADSDDRGKRRW